MVLNYFQLLHLEHILSFLLSELLRYLVFELFSELLILSHFFSVMSLSFTFFSYFVFFITLFSVLFTELFSISLELFNPSVRIQSKETLY